jgi:hypothetical protein
MQRLIPRCSDVVSNDLIGWLDLVGWIIAKQPISERLHLHQPTNQQTNKPTNQPARPTRPSINIQQLTLTTLNNEQ